MQLLLAAILTFSPGCPPRPVVVDDDPIPSVENGASQVFAKAKKTHEDGKHEEAVDELRGYLARFRDSADAAEARWLLAKSYAALGRDSDEKRALKTLVERHPDSPRAREARLRLGELHMHEGDPDDAISLLRRSLDQATGQEKKEIAKSLVEASLEDERWVEAVRWMEEIRLMASNRKERREADDLLIELIDRRMPAVGLALLRQELSDDSPALPLVMMKIARLHFHQREHRLAFEMLEEYLRRWPRGEHAGDARDLHRRMEQLGEVEPRVVGVILPLSGRAEPFGEAVLRGLGIAMDLGDSSEITLLLRDSEGDPDVAVEALEELVLQEKAIAIIGPLLSGTSRAVAAKAQELGVPMVSLARAEGLPQMGSWVFRNALSDAVQAAALVEHAAEHLGAKTFGILYPNHDYGRGLMNHFWDEVEARELEVRGVERYDHDETTFQPIIRKMVGRHHLQYRHEYMDEVRRIRNEITDPIRRRRELTRALDDALPIPEFDVLFIPDSYQRVGLIAPALAVEEVITNVCDERDLERIKDTTGREELTKVQLLGPNAWNHPELVTRGGRHVRCSVFVDGFFSESERPETKAFVELYEQIHGAGARPDYLEAHGYDTAAIVQFVIEELRPSDRVGFREALLGLSGFPGATGNTRFGPEGEAKKEPFLLTVDRDDIVELELEPGEEPPTG